MIKSISYWSKESLRSAQVLRVVLLLLSAKLMGHSGSVLTTVTLLIVIWSVKLGPCRTSKLISMLWVEPSSSVTDVQSVFHQLPVADSDVESTAFVTAKGKYCFIRMPFGVCNAPWLYQRMMSLALGDTGSASGLCYMNDLIACSPTWEDTCCCSNACFQLYKELVWR